jgi:CDP-glucose 4,6-dehydratase
MFKNINLLKNKTVLITGHTGFKGAWLAIWLNEIGARVIGYSLDPIGENNLFALSNLKDKIIDIRGDIRDYKKLKMVFDQYQPEVVFHLAAQPLVKYSYDHPVYTYEVNVLGTMNVLEAIRKCDSTKTGIMITSDKCYENQEWVWGYRENDPIGGHDPYSSSKGCCEILVSSYRNSYFHVDQFEEHGKVIASVRAGNVIGGGDWSLDRIIPDCIRALESDQEIIIRAPHSIRPWQHVLEPLGGYLLLAAKLLEEGTLYSGAWNFGPESDSISSVEVLVNKLLHYWGCGRWLEDRTNSTVHEAKLLGLDINKAKNQLNWHPRWNIDKTIEKTAEWYKSYKQTDVYSLCVNQINEYCKTEK